MSIPALPEQHSCHFPRLRYRMVERPHQFLVIENRLGFRKWCTTTFTDGSTDKILCPTIGTELNERHGPFPFIQVHTDEKRLLQHDVSCNKSHQPFWVSFKRASSPGTFSFSSIAHDQWCLGSFGNTPFLQVSS